MSMNEIVPNLWVGDLPSALNANNLREHKIRSVLTAMRGRVSIHETFIRHQINIDDTETSDILQHFVPAITFIQSELDKEHGVLVHCQAGMSRSVAIVTAYLMVTMGLDADNALEVIRKARPDVQPNDGFMHQLDIFHQASYKVSKHDKETRLFYLERVVNEVMNGEGEIETEMWAKFPNSPSDSPHPQPKRRIRCKMCRQELAAREHMLDHGQLGPPTPAVLSAANSRRPSMNDPKPLSPLASGAPAPRRASSGVAVKPNVPPMSPSGVGVSRRPSQHDPLPRSRLGSITEGRVVQAQAQVRDALRALDSASVEIGQQASDAIGESAIVDDSDEEEQEQSKDETDSQEKGKGKPTLGNGLVTSPAPMSPPNSTSSSTSPTATSARPPEKMAPRTSQSGGARPPVSFNTFVHPTDLAAQLASNPKLAGLRPPAGLSMTPMMPLSAGLNSNAGSATSGGPSPSRSAPVSPGLAAAMMRGANANYFTPVSPPILANPKCSGYFVEPMKWMEPFLEQGHMAGKIMCPNKKCNAKLGNYDWAGVCCSCKEWVVPGFCIHRSKVDEVS